MQSMSGSIIDSEKFVSCRVGLEFTDYHENLEKLLADNKIYGLNKRHDPNYDESSKGNFVIVPVTSPRRNYFDANSDCRPPKLLPDLVLPKSRWEYEVAVSTGMLPIFSERSKESLKRFERVLSHAFYLPSRVIVIDMNPNKQSHKPMANVINECLRKNSSPKLVLIKICVTPASDELNGINSNHHTIFSDSGRESILAETGRHKNAPLNTDESSTESGLGQCKGTRKSSPAIQNELLGGWEAWNNIRSHLIPDHRIGVCLLVDNNLEEEDIDDTNRWKGEPVRMIVMNMDRFVSAPGIKSSMRPARGIKALINMVVLRNSMMTSLVLQAKTDCDPIDQLTCLSNLCDQLNSNHPDPMRAWDDLLLDQLQPLSNNLDSDTYNIFEQDKAKYSKYHDAMVKALKSLLGREDSVDRTKFTLMVLGAGRGPLVDQMISAILKLKTRGKQFKIYALDKNFSSVSALEYKKAKFWDSHWPVIQTVVVESDMRLWTPEDKADVIATELLGSFADNELSPECIDGTWRFSTPDTISIPQSYSSYIAPICSYRIRQRLRRFAEIPPEFDKIQVARLCNYYMIDSPKRLFTYQHSRLDRIPQQGANRREICLKFSNRYETTCHGFAGFFEANLFGDVFISTNPETKTPGMESWFPMYIPIEEPIALPANTPIEVRFSRKDDHERVWYEWMIMKPDPSRVHNKGGERGSMSKLI